MSVAVLRTSSRDPAAANHPITLAMWRPQPGALMLLGRARGPLPKAGSVRKGTLPGAPGVFRAESWPLSEPGFGFLLAIRLPQAADQSDGAELVLRGARGADRDFSLTLVRSSEASEFGKEVAPLAGAHAAQLTRFMLDVMRPDGSDDTRQRAALLDAFLSHAARMDGCVELIIHVPQRCVLLQGWGARLADPAELLIPGSDMSRHPVASGNFARGDVTSPATGSVLALPPDAASAMSKLEKVYLLSGDDLLCRHVVEPRMLDAEASIGQIRHLLPRLNCPAPLRTLLRAALQPHFSGRDTLNNGARPVRAALDLAVVGEGVGVYLSGWVFDPAHHTAELHLCTADDAVRLDESWVRAPRQDVSAAFAADPAFPSPFVQDWGFAVSTSIVAPDTPAHLRFTFIDGDLAFVPIRFASSYATSVRNALLASVDMHVPSGAAIVEQHLAPFLAGAPTRQATTARLLMRGPIERARAIVVPLPTPYLPRSFVSGFLLDPPTVDEQVVFVCGPNWEHAQLERLASLFLFYALPASVIGLERVPLPADAVHEAAAMTEADYFLLTSPGIVGSMPGWRHAIYQAAGTDPAACPTVLFEDHSIRFAGPKHVAFLDRAPFVNIHTPFAGACADLVAPGEPTRAETGSFACCLIARCALPALARAARLTTESGQEAAFFFALREAGLHSTWMPAIRVFAPEEDVTQAASAPLIDGWILRHGWKGAASCVS